MMTPPPRSEAAFPGQVFTPPELAALLSEVVLEGAGTAPLRILDPACGAGALLHALEPQLPLGSERVGVELDPAILTMARTALLPSASKLQLIQGDALEVLQGAASSFDRVVSNPPYMGWTSIPSVLRARLESGTFLGAPFPARPNHADAQPDYSLAFLLLALHVLKPGGRLVFLMPPEWLVAPRLYALREHLNQNMRIRALVELPPRYPMFHSLSGRRIETEALILVAERAEVSSRHVMPWVTLDVGMPPACLKGVWPTLFSSPSRWPKLLTKVDGDAEISQRFPLIQAVVQRALQPEGWRKSPRRVPPGMVPLGALKGVKVFGGHQPVVSWLLWLTLEHAEWLALPLDERSVLFPAVQEAREFTWPVVAPSGRFWCFFPPNATEAQLLRRYPQLMACLRGKCLAFHGASAVGEVRPGVESTANVEALPEGWWRFPNPRNGAFLGMSGPQLLFPRTAHRLQASWDPVGHTFKGTNVAVRVVSGAERDPERDPERNPEHNPEHNPGVDPEILLLALFGYFNSEVGRAQAEPFLRQYHQLGCRLEPADVKRLPVPRPELSAARDAWTSLARASEAFLKGDQGIDLVDRAALELVTCVQVLP